MEQSLARVGDFARRCGVPEARVRKAIQGGLIPIVAIGRRLRIDIANLPQNYMEHLSDDIWHRPGRAAECKVYFIGPEDGPIKIGLARNVEWRRNQLQVGCWAPLLVHATIAGADKAEREYHQRFAAYRLHGEWFERAPEILAEIDRLNGPASDWHREQGLPHERIGVR